MKLQKYVSNIYLSVIHLFKNINLIYIKTPIFLGVFMFLFSCKNDIEEVQKLTAKQDSAIVSAKNVEMKYTVSANTKVFMKAPVLDRYIEQDGTAYTDFPKGMRLKFFDEEGNISSTLKANYSIYRESEGIWEARYKVEAVNEKGEMLETEYLIWDQKSEKISTDQSVTMTTKDGVIYGDGFVSNQDFTDWEIVNGRGVISVEEYE